jgi:hypothetical protein
MRPFLLVRWLWRSERRSWEEEASAAAVVYPAKKAGSETAEARRGWVPLGGIHAMPARPAREDRGPTASREHHGSGARIWTFGLAIWKTRRGTRRETLGRWTADVDERLCSSPSPPPSPARSLASAAPHWGPGRSPGEWGRRFFRRDEGERRFPRNDSKEVKRKGNLTD